MMLKGNLGKSLFVILCVAFFAGLLATASQVKSLWEDEVFIVNYSQQSLEKLAVTASWENHPPTYLYMAHYWGEWFGYDANGLRSMSILFAVIGLLFTYLLARDILGERTARITLLLTAIMPLLVMFSHNARYYSLAFALAMLVAFSMNRFAGPGKILYLLLYVASGAALLYLIFSGASVLLAANAWWLLRWLRDKTRRNFLSLLMWFLAQVAIILLYLPGWNQLFAVSERFSQIVELENQIIEIAKRAMYFGFVASVGESISPLNPISWVGILAVVTICIYAIFRNRKNLNLWLPILFFLLITGINLVFTFSSAIAQTWQNVSYRALYAIPFLMIWIAAGIASMKPRLAWVAGGILCAIYALGVVNYLTNRQMIRPVYSVPWQTIFMDIQEKAQPGALVLCGNGDNSCNYYSTRAGFSDNFLGNWEKQKANEFPEVWFVLTNLGREDDRKEFQEEVLDELEQLYPAQDRVNYAKQDPGIRRLKSLMTDQEDYEFRVNVIRFYQP
jgi:uncharacterized membrane protein